MLLSPQLMPFYRWGKGNSEKLNDLSNTVIFNVLWFVGTFEFLLRNTRSRGAGTRWQSRGSNLAQFCQPSSSNNFKITSQIKFLTPPQTWAQVKVQITNWNWFQFHLAFNEHLSSNPGSGTSCVTLGKSCILCLDFLNCKMGITLAFTFPHYQLPWREDQTLLERGHHLF